MEKAMPLEISYAIQQPFTGQRVFQTCGDLARSVNFHRITGMYAFASLKGARLLVDAMSSSRTWRTCCKRWVISIDGGITEPAALQFLLRLPNSEVRVPDAEELLRNRLRPVRRFHPKALLLDERRRDLIPVALLVGSANLTLSGLSLGHEHVVSVRATGDSTFPSELAAETQLVEELVQNSTLIGADFIRRYDECRPAEPQSPAEDRDDERTERILHQGAVIRPREAAALASASNFWIQVDYVVQNRGTYEGNQIDLKRGSRVFFGFADQSLPRNSLIGTVTLVYGEHASERNLRFGNNSMDKLDLPIPGSLGPPSYEGTTLLFTRLARSRFRLTVGAPEHLANWRERSRQLGTLFAMRSGREFGVF